MRPKPFKPEVWNVDKRYVKDATTGLFWHRCEHRILYADTDRSQVVYHANYLRYFECGRSSLMRDMDYPYRTIEEKGYVYPVIELGVNFYRPLFYDDPIYIHTRPAKLEKVRVQFDYIVTHTEKEDMIICKGFTKHCALNSSGFPVGIDSTTVHIWQTFPK